jgi:hypothetical protein
MTENDGIEYPLPCTPVLWYWNPWLRKPVVFPAKRDPATGQPVVLLTDEDVAEEVAEVQRINLAMTSQGGPPYRLSFVPPEKVQEWIDRQAAAMMGDKATAEAQRGDNVYAQGIDREYLEIARAPVRPEPEGGTEL